MLIGELSKRTGLTKDTIRFYEKQQLIPAGRKERPFNNYKEYTDETLNKLLIIKKIKSFGFTLNEAAELLDMVELNTATCTAVSEKVAEKVGVIDLKIRELEALKGMMLQSVSDCRSCCVPESPEDNCPILTVD